MIKQTAVAALTAAAALTLPAAAGAHVTMQPGNVPAGSFTKVDVRVPNERDNRGTVKVVLKLPNGFHFLSYQKVPGWRVRVYREKLDTPVDLGGFSVDEQFTRVVWRARNARHRIAPGQFQDFPLSVRTPDGAPGTVVSFRAIQTYQGGEVVRWAGAPDADQPAPRITLTATEEH
jgi:periplasmic copper chaperone A